MRSEHVRKVVSPADDRSAVRSGVSILLGNRSQPALLPPLQAIAKELVPISGSEPFRVELSGLATNSNFNAKSSQLVLFLNQRLVECPPLHKLIESVYSQFLPKGAHPFVYLDLRVPVRRLSGCI